MFGADDVLAGVIASSIFEITKLFFNELIPGQEVSGEIQKAFEKGLNNWDKKHGDILNSKVSRSSYYKKEFKEILLKTKSFELFDNDTKEILKYFKEEILKNPIANNYFQDIQLQEHIRLLKLILDKMDRSNPLLDFDSFKEDINEKLTAIGSLIKESSNKKLDKVTQDIINKCIDLVDTQNNLIKDLPQKDFIEKQFEDIRSILNELVLSLKSVFNQNEDSKFREILLAEKKETLIELPYDFFVKENITLEDYIQRKIILTSDYDTSEDNPNQEQIINVVLKEKSKTALLASAGLGKSTELKNLVHALLTKKYYPILVLLNSYDSSSFEGNLPKKWELVPEDKLVIILDGFDEIDEGNKIKRSILKFSNEHPEIRLVLSCRTNMYKVEIEERDGTLKKFKSFYLMELSNLDIEEYLKIHIDILEKQFITDFERLNLLELLKNPFYLKLFVKYYKDHKSFPKNKADLIEYCIKVRFNKDEEHYEETYDLDAKKHVVFKLLRRLSLALEIVGDTLISDDDLRTFIDKVEDFNMIKYATVFKKFEKDNNQWIFEHRSFQEYLCAKLFVGQSLSIIKKFTTYYNNDIIIPSWFNTLNILMSLCDSKHSLLKELSTWMYVEQKGLIPNIEKEDLTDEMCFVKLKTVFERNKQLKIWINVNTINEFGKSNKDNDSIDYLLNEVSCRSNHDIVVKNALHLIESLFFESYHRTSELRQILLKLLKDKVEDPYFVFSIIVTINKCGFNDKETIDYVFNLVGLQKHQYTRAIMYKYLVNSYSFEDYIDYYLDGYILIGSKNEERADTSLLDESFNLREGIKKFKSAKALKKILDIEFQSNEFENDFESNETFQVIINNTIEAYLEDKEMYSYVLSLLNHNSIHWYNNKIEIISAFFKETQTQDKVFKDMLKSIFSKGSHYMELMTLALFTNSSNLLCIIKELKNSEESENIFKGLYNNLKSRDKDLGEEFKILIEKETEIRIQFPKKIDWTKIRKDKRQKSFNALFDKDKLREECIRVFDGNKELSWDELWDIGRDDFDEIEDTYTASSLTLIRTFARNNRKVTKQIILDFFENHDRFEWFFIEETVSCIKRNDDLHVSNNQKEILKAWFDKYVNKIDFKSAITSNDKGGFSINDFSIVLMYLVKKFNFHCTQEKYLDMLSATIDNMSGADMIQFGEIAEKIEDKDELNERIINNIKERKIAMSSLYDSHVKYIIENNLTEAFPIIIDDIIEMRYEDHILMPIINYFFEKPGYEKYIKDIVERLRVELFIYVIEKLIKKDEYDFCKTKLLKLYTNLVDIENRRKVCLLLINCHAKEGLEYLVKWVEENNYTPFKYNDKGIGVFTYEIGFKLLFNLLELSYNIPKSDNFEYSNMTSVVSAGLENIVIASEAECENVIKKLKDFLEENIDKYEGIGYLSGSIETIEINFYQTRVKKYTVKEAKNMIEEFIIE